MTIGDLLTGGPEEIKGNPQTSAIVLVEVDLVPPKGQIVHEDYQLGGANTYLRNIETGELFYATDSRWGYWTFSNVEPGDYHFSISNFAIETIDEDMQYSTREPEVYKWNYHHSENDIWQTQIQVNAGDVVYHGVSMQPSAEREPLLDIDISPSTDKVIDDDGQTIGPAVRLIDDSEMEKSAWTDYFLGVYPNTLWTDAVNKHIMSL